MERPGPGRVLGVWVGVLRGCTWPNKRDIAMTIWDWRMWKWKEFLRERDRGKECVCVCERGLVGWFLQVSARGRCW